MKTKVKELDANQQQLTLDFSLLDNELIKKEAAELNINLNNNHWLFKRPEGWGLLPYTSEQKEYLDNNWSLIEDEEYKSWLKYWTGQNEDSNAEPSKTV